jgi:hypothetical protein
VGAFGGFYVDTDAYPASGCTHPITGKNCINDAQLQAEIKRVMALKGWKTGLGNMFLVFTSSGEGSCLDANVCAYIYYCAYHGAFGSATSPTIYGNEPYADPNYCFAGGQQAPNGDVHADLAANIASHEMTEANTDPELNAWWNSANGEEIGDLCVWMFGTLTWDSGHANQMWNGHFYDLQMEYDNHTASCIQQGP